MTYLLDTQSRSWLAPLPEKVEPWPKNNYVAFLLFAVLKVDDIVGSGLYLRWLTTGGMTKSSF